MRIDQGLREGIADLGFGEMQGGFIKNLADQLQRHVEWLGPHQVYGKIGVIGFGAHIAHLAMQVANIVYTQNEPLRPIVKVFGLEQDIQAFQLPGKIHCTDVFFWAIPTMPIQQI